MLRTRNDKKSDDLEHIHRYFYERWDLDGYLETATVVTVAPDGIRITGFIGDEIELMKPVTPREMMDALAGIDGALYGMSLDALEQTRRGDTVNIIHYPGSGIIHSETFRKGRVPRGWADRYAEEYLDAELWEETA